MKPSLFICYPWNSVTKNAEHEIIAMNIMMILKRTGDTFRQLSYEEYSEERKSDGGFSDAEKILFDEVITYCKSAENASFFCPDWKKIFESNNFVSPVLTINL